MLFKVFPQISYQAVHLVMAKAKYLFKEAYVILMDCQWHHNAGMAVRMEGVEEVFSEEQGGKIGE